MNDERNNLIVGAWPNVVEIPSDKVNFDRLLLFELIFALIGQLVGLVCVLLGVWLFFVGVSGTGTWTTEFLGLKINSAPPGAMLTIIGLAWAYQTRFQARMKVTRGPVTEDTTATAPN